MIWCGSFGPKMNASPAPTSVDPSLSRTLPSPLMIKYISHCAECPPIGKFDLPGGIRFHSRSNGHRLDKSSDSGSRPSASEILFNALANLPLGDCHGSSLISLTLTVFTFQLHHEVHEDRKRFFLTCSNLRVLRVLRGENLFF